jgi:hypothetical protein
MSINAKAVLQPVLDALLSEGVTPLRLKYSSIKEDGTISVFLTMDEADKESGKRALAQVARIPKYRIIPWPRRRTVVPEPAEAPVPEDEPPF